MTEPQTADLLIRQMSALLATSQLMLKAICDECDIDPDECEVVLSLKGPDGSREVARETLTSLFARIDAIQTRVGA